MDPLAKLFSSSARLKLLRLFLFNDEIAVTLADAAFRTNGNKDSVRKELNVLLAAGVIKKRPGKDGVVYTPNKRFEHNFALQNFLKDTTKVSDSSINNLLKKSGSLRLIVLSGSFTNAVETKADLLVVGDKLDEKQLNKAVHEIESELGRELRFAHFSTEDFRYRVGVYDRLIRDIFDYPHRTILDKIGMRK
jgi:hypothetical protein